VTGNLEFLTTRQLAEELSVSRTVVASLARQGTLPARRLSNGRLMFERGMFERWIQHQYADTRRWVLEHDHDGYPRRLEGLA
jgi:excisionase family DNA binding protein